MLGVPPIRWATGCSPWPKRPSTTARSTSRRQVFGLRAALPAESQAQPGARAGAVDPRRARLRRRADPGLRARREDAGRGTGRLRRGRADGGARPLSGRAPSPPLPARPRRDRARQGKPRGRGRAGSRGRGHVDRIAPRPRGAQARGRRDAGAGRDAREGLGLLPGAARALPRFAARSRRARPGSSSSASGCSCEARVARRRARGAPRNGRAPAGRGRPPPRAHGREAGGPPARLWSHLLGARARAPRRVAAQLPRRLVPSSRQRRALERGDRARRDGGAGGRGGGGAHHGRDRGQQHGGDQARDGAAHRGLRPAERAAVGRRRAARPRLCADPLHEALGRRGARREALRLRLAPSCTTRTSRGNTESSSRPSRRPTGTDGRWPRTRPWRGAAASPRSPS